MCVHARAGPIILVFVPGVEYGFLCVYNVMREFFEGMCLNIVVFITCFVASVMVYLLMFLFVHSYCKACCSLFFFNVLYKSPLLLLLLCNYYFFFFLFKIESY